MQIKQGSPMKIRVFILAGTLFSLTGTVNAQAPFGGENDVDYAASLAVRYWDPDSTEFEEADAPGRIPIGSPGPTHTRAVPLKKISGRGSRYT